MDWSVSNLKVQELALIEFGCGILRMVGPKMQDFCPRINMLKGNFYKKNPAMTYGSSKSAEIVISKSIIYLKKFSKKKFI